jgi:hypothetical protein
MPSTSPPTELTPCSAIACNDSQRTRTALSLEGTEVDVVEVDLLDRPEEQRPDPPLLPGDILERYRENYRRLAARR